MEVPDDGPDAPTPAPQSAVLESAVAAASALDADGLYALRAWIDARLASAPGP